MANASTTLNPDTLCSTSHIMQILSAGTQPCAEHSMRQTHLAILGQLSGWAAQETWSDAK